MDDSIDETGGAGTSEAASGLTDELARRLTVKDQPSPSASATSEVSDMFRLQPRLLCEERHDSGEDGLGQKTAEHNIVSKWRQKEKLKTTAVALVLCLNIGVDPPDVIKISPCARLECWVDPLSMQPTKALETIGKNLQAQYERWQPRAKYKMHLDPTVDDVKKLCVSCRRNAKNERVLFHYNGHGVPRPTVNGEIWVFNSRYTQYIPLSVYELQTWLGTPCIYVLDCSAAGLIINSFRAFMDPRQQEPRAAAGAQPYMPFTMGGGDPMKEIIVLGACAGNELLPQNPDLPADVFTACLTTPIRVALRWFCSRSLLRHEGINKELIDRIPGRQTDRKTPLGELNWIFTAITDTIAWNMLPRALFQKLFRSDLLVASLFRNFLLAERIMMEANCMPTSYPRLPPTHQHPMWQAWDMAAEMCLLQLPALNKDPNTEFQPSSFFTEQLTAFELWLAHGSKDKKPPEQLPIVLQVLLSQVHRLRALVLLGRFLDMGPWAVDLALSVGIFPYVLKLLQTHSTDLRTTLVFIWCKILALDKTCQVDLVKDTGHLYFLKYLDSADMQVDLHSRAQAAFVMAVICDKNPKGQALCASSNLQGVVLKWLRTLVAAPHQLTTHTNALLVKWLCLALGKLCENLPEISLLCIREGSTELLAGLSSFYSPEIRAAAVFALGCLIHSCPDAQELAEGAAALGLAAQAPASEERLVMEQPIIGYLTKMVYDGSALVRAEAAVALARIARGHLGPFQEAVTMQQRKARPPAHVSMDDGEVPAAMRAHSFTGTTMWQGRDTSGLDQAGHDSHGRGSSDTPARVSAPPTTTAWGQPASLEAACRVSEAAPQQGSGGGGSFLPGSGDSSSGSGSAGGSCPSTVYTIMVEAVVLLATDPSPKVARLGRDVLRIAQCELTPLATSSTHPSNGTLSPRHASQITLGSFAQRLKPKSWRSTFTAGSQRMSHITSVASTPSSSSPPSPTREASHHLAYGRHPCVLRSTAAPGSSVGDYSGGASAGSAGVSLDPNSMGAAQEVRLHGGAPAPSVSVASGLPMTPEHYPLSSEPLPASIIYKLSCEYFSRPMLEPQASAWRESEGCVVAHWTAPVDGVRRQQRIREIDNGITKCKSLITPKLREQVVAVETGAESISAVVFHPYHPVIITADSRGFIRTNNYGDTSSTPCINAFHVTNGAALNDTRTVSSTVVCLRQMNETDGPILLCGALDGGVRVWRSYALSGQHRMAAAWQAVPIYPPPVSSYTANRPAVYEWSARLGSLFAAGGREPDTLQRWDLACEVLSQQICVAPPGSHGTWCVERIALSACDPHLLLTACSNGCVSLFDVRTASQPVMSFEPFRQSMAGVVMEPNGRQGLVVTGSTAGELKFLDMRLGAGGEGSEGRSVLRVVEAHSKGGMSELVAHPHAPLLATATTTQVVKVWTDTGEPVGAIRAQSSFLAHKMGPVTCMAFHPYQLLLAAAGGDSVCSVYAIDNDLRQQGLHLSRSATNTPAPVVL